MPENAGLSRCCIRDGTRWSFSQRADTGVDTSERLGYDAGHSVDRLNPVSRMDPMRLSLRRTEPFPAALPGIRREFIRVALITLLLLSFTAVLACAQDYTSVVVFGDSLSDIGNVAHLTQAKYGIRVPSPAGGDYTDGRFTDGFDTIPAARNDSGVWIEQLAAMLPSHPVLTDSLDGGTDYAYGFAFTRNGTSPLTFGPSNSFSVTVDNIGRQITDYLAGRPRISDKTLFVVWGGANDILSASSPNDVFYAAIDEIVDIQRLIAAGASQILVLNLPPLGLTPRLNGSPVTSGPADQASMLYNDVLNLGVSILRGFSPGRRLVLAQLDVYSLFTQVVAAPLRYDLANVTSSSQGQYTVDPDTYLFWDDLHPTTRGHSILAAAAFQLLQSSTCRGISASRQRSCAAAPWATP
jgi:outer membrane lipase/esterase